MKVKAWILDVNQEVARDQSQEIWLWAIKEDGERVLLIDKGFAPFFYVIPKEGVSIEELEASVKSQVRASDLVSLKVVEKKRLGKLTKVLRVELRNDDVIEQVAKHVAKLYAVKEVLEDDVRATFQYFMHTGISPSSWIEAEVADSPISIEGINIPAYLAMATPKPVEDGNVPKLRVLALHVIVPAFMSSPSPDRDQIGVIAAVNEEGERWVFVNERGDDKPLLLEFVKLIQSYDPDVVVSWGANKWLWSFLIERSKRIGVKLDIGRQKVEPHQSLYGHFSIIGRINVDLLDIVADDPEVKVKTLENAAKHYKVWDGEVIDQAFYGEVWESSGGKERLVNYASKCANAVMGIWKLFSHYLAQLSSLIKYPMDYAVAASPGFRVEGYLMSRAHQLGELIPKRPEVVSFETYRGGMVLEPKPGIHNYVAVLDFAAMYPHLIMKYNISPDTYVPEDVAISDQVCYVAPEVGHRFLKEPDGLYKLSLTALLEARDSIRQFMKRLSPDDPRYAAYEAQQKAIKVIANAVYGYAGWVGARWYLKPVAEAVAAWGRATISTALKIAKELGLEVIYGDTDSLFLRYDQAKVEEFKRRVFEQLGLEVKVDKLYKRVLFTEAKKRYVGLMEDDSLDVVGLEAARGDWCEAAKQLQEEVAHILLTTDNVQKAVEHAKQAIKKLKAGKFSIKDLVIWKTLSKPLDEYKVSAPHVTAALRLKKAGWDVKPGDQIGFVIVKGSGKVHERAYPYALAHGQPIDSDYYIENQLIPAALRILEVVGVKKEQLKQAEVVSLLDFFTQQP
ncbi:MAG: DNA polymerase II [Candidatus Methanomethylicota archaeon]|uniref:DNA polymerase n=2 Tax=Thermoproteota archaeon TaxID=2056631 RepID=A0A497ELY4_9CREN|nr:MAG: DNA polymerase II [Candidatus Verstraetearchaeota archaeon]